MLFPQQDGMVAPAAKKDPVRMWGCPSTSLLSMRLPRPVLHTHTLKGVLIVHREVYGWFDGENPTLVCPSHYRMLSIPTPRSYLAIALNFSKHQLEIVCRCVYMCACTHECICVKGM